VTVTDSKGCTATGKDTIVQPAVLTSTITSTNAGCSCNGTASLNPSGGTLPYTYTWNTVPVQTTQTVTGLCAGNFSVTVRDNNGCSDTHTTSVTQSPPVVVSVSPNQTICSGTTTSIGAFVTGTNINYAWNPGALNGDTVSVTPAGTTNYTVIASNTSSGCADTGFVMVNVISSPTATISGQDTVCVGTQITLTGSGSGNYSWSPGNQTGTSITITPTVTGTSTYTLIVSNSSANITCSDIATFTVIAVSSPQINLTATTYSLCAGIATDTLIASGGTSYYWTSTPAGSYPQNGSIIVSPDLTTTYTVYVSNGVGCSGTSVVTINVSAGYSNPAVTPNPASYCFGDSILPFYAPNPAPPAGVGWTDLQGNLLWLGNVYSPPQNLSVGTYTILCVQGTGANCLSYPTFVIATIHPLPLANAGGDVTICAGHTAHLQASGGINYWWSPGTHLSDSLNSNPSATPDSTFSYQVIVADANNCKDKDSVTVYISTSDTCGIHIYNGITPNGDGDNDIWFIDGINLYPDNFVDIFNRWGNSVWSGKNYDNKKVVWRGQNMSGQPLPSGTYYYVIDIKELGRFSKWVELTR
jgi:gliding motility-associated-like protein